MHAGHRGDRAAAARLIEENRFPIQADACVERLSPAGRQLVEICRALLQGSSLLIFDEPTSSLSDAETKEVFRLVKGNGPAPAIEGADVKTVQPVTKTSDETFRSMLQLNLVVPFSLGVGA